jgi:hypothetical protein
MAAYIWIKESMEASGVRDAWKGMTTSDAEFSMVAFLEAYKKRTGKMCVCGIRP